MQKTYKTAIIGGGSAGLMCAVELLSGADALSGEEVIIIERNDRVGKKLIATGNGQGNLMNGDFNESFYYGDKGFISAFVDCADKLDLYAYLNKLGIPLSSKKAGKVFPLSKQASAVLDIIRAFLSFKNCTVETGKRVTKVEKNDDVFTIFCGHEQILAQNVVMATGGSAGKQFGTDGTAYKLMTDFGHKLTALYPSLVQLKTDTTCIKGLKGLKETARVTAFDGARPLRSVSGDLLFTDFGVSGNTIFQLSACIAGKKDAYLIVEFLPELSYSETEKLLLKRVKMKHLKKEDLLCGILNKRIGQAVLKYAKSDSVEDIAYAIKNFKLKVTGSLDFSYAQVTRGGIKTADVDAETYRSKLCKGMYIVGEALDVDGECGGYNLTFAFVSGITSAKAIKKELA